MKSRFLSFLAQNRLGAILGIIYGAASFLMFFFGLSYGAACPESGPTICDARLEPIIPVFLAISIMTISIWGVIFYSGQQLLLLFGVTTPTDYSSSFFAVNILPGISIAVTLFVLTMIGGSAQKLWRRIRK